MRTRRARRLRDVRSLGELFPFFAPHGFLRVHHNHAVNLGPIREIRRRRKGEDWKLKLEPPVHRALPVSRAQIGKLLKAYGGKTR